MIEYINDDNSKSLEGAEAFLLYFYSEGCRPCAAASSAVEAFALDNAELTVGKAEASTAPALCSRYRVRSVPTLVFVKDGAEVSRISGKCTRDDIAKAVFGSSASSL